MSGVAFGLIVGYLSWYAFRPGETSETIPIERIAALLAVVGGAAILTLFPAGTTLFEWYGVGLVLGFFAKLLGKNITRLWQVLLAEQRKSSAAKKLARKREAESIEENWLTIDRLIQHKLSTSTKSDERAPRCNYLDLSDLQELQYSAAAMEYIMKRFAEIHVRDDVTYAVWSGKPVILKNRWQL